ncbi:hypothetical protein LJ656_21660 [Paraburkholderia sp. MMS20-SJTR3]|uniref:Uncharacterized protein n=1 Tax=Paraburkholderia sejongensis TaxID=2886946 RepID=A0ABS8K003_9BURK|nr:hypothetical protein [Paraburkholderia sp. MMS20-SJTR3]MCC8395199.1 hypothetical protein [Paraburkholderia sp. MMS20-SJTR3]
MPRSAFVAAAVCAACLTSACVHIGPSRLKADQVDYARALGDAKKREILAAVIGLRYGDAPAFLTVSNIIAAYTFDTSGGATLNAGSGSMPNYAQATAGVSYSNRPTFTFTPTTGEAFASAYIRPLAPSLVLPLAEGGVPIDLLLRITAQSIGGLQNGNALGGENSAGAPGFFELIQALRRLQLAGELNIETRQVDARPANKAAGKSGNDAAATAQLGVFLTIGATSSGESARTAADVARVRKLLHLSPKTHSYEIVYGPSSGYRNGERITMVTRSVLGILSDLGAQVQVPPERIADGSTKPTVGLIGGETRPTIIIHSGQRAPADAYVSIAYGPSVYWVERNDFDSKYAFTVVQNLMALAEADTSNKAPVVTIPAN